MGYIGTKPSAVPLTSADITDNVITSAKIVDGTIANADIANSTINLTTKVTGSLPVANGGTGLTAIGTASQVLRVNSGATALEFATPAAGGAFKLVTRTAITSDVSSVSFTGLTANVIHHFQLNAIDSVTNAGEDLLLRVSTNGGSSYQTSGYYNSLWQHYSSGSTNNQTKTDSLISLNDGMTDSGTEEGVNGFVYIYNIGNSAQKVMAVGNTVSVADANYLRSNHMGGIYDTAANVTAVQFLFDSGNISGSTKAFITHYEQVIA